MVQSGNGHEGAPAAPLDDLAYGVEHAAHDVARRLEHAEEGRGVPVVQEAAPGAGLRLDLLHVVGGMEQQKILFLRQHRFAHRYLPFQPFADEALPEGVETVRPEGVALAEAIARQLLTGVDADSGFFACMGNPP